MTEHAPNFGPQSLMLNIELRAVKFLVLFTIVQQCDNIHQTNNLNE